MTDLIERGALTGELAAYLRLQIEAGRTMLISGGTGIVQSVDANTNTITVKRDDGGVVSYDPKRLKGVNVYREVQREIAEGERVQFTTSHKELGVANRYLGTVTRIEPNRINVRMDAKEERIVTFHPREMRHFDHGYAVTSHSSQGLTTGRIIANIDGETARIYTNDATTLGQRLATEVSKTAALEFRPVAERTYTPAEIERHHAPIRNAVEPQDAVQFKWKAETGSIQTYRHTETGRNIHVDDKGRFYSQDGKRTSQDQDASLDRSMPSVRTHSQNEIENSLGLAVSYQVWS